MLCIKLTRSSQRNAIWDLLIRRKAVLCPTRTLLSSLRVPDRVAHSDNQKEDFLALASTRKRDRYERLSNTWVCRVPPTFHILSTLSLSLSLSLFSIRVCSSKKRIYILGCRILLFIFLFLFLFLLLLLLLFSSSVNDLSFLFYRPFLSYSGKGKSVKRDGWKNKREARGRELRELKMTSRESGGVTV